MVLRRMLSRANLPIFGAHATVETGSALSAGKANSATGSHL